MSFFENYKIEILGYLEAFLHQRSAQMSRINRWGQDLSERLYHYTAGGKVIRGSLVCLGYSMFQPSLAPDAVAAGAAMELVQSALLIHDDIMDQDALRRGEPSFHQQYRVHGKLQKLKKPKQFGESMGICGGDVAFFLAFEILSSLKETPAEIKSRLVQTFGSELSLVGLAQMEDVFFEAWTGDPEKKEIENLYRYKTARYTFSLPLLMGGILGQANESALDDLSEIGEKMGLLFQITDDELELLRSTEEIGKPAGSDVMKNKKTLHRRALFEACDQKEKEELRLLFGSSEITGQDMNKIRTLLEKKGVLFDMEEWKKDLVRETEILIQNLRVNPLEKQIFSNFLSYLAKRNK